MYFTKRNELSTEQGCMLCGSRVENTSSCHQVMLDELREEHRCINKTKALGEHLCLLARNGCGCGEYGGKICCMSLDVELTTCATTTSLAMVHTYIADDPHWLCVEGRSELPDRR